MNFKGKGERMKYKLKLSHERKRIGEEEKEPEKFS